jgi:hypothetical protein
MVVPAGDAVRLVSDQGGTGRLVVAEIGGYPILARLSGSL